MQTPQRVFATHPSHQAKSTREFDTAHPTASKLGLELNTDFNHGQEAELAAALVAESSPALVVWHHGSIPALMKHFGIANSHEIPNEWPEDRFDLLWVLTRESSTDLFTWQSVNQSLLHGDAR